jgi:hypothetical protein
MKPARTHAVEAVPRPRFGGGTVPHPKSNNGAIGFGSIWRIHDVLAWRRVPTTMMTASYSSSTTMVIAQSVVPLTVRWVDLCGDMMVGGAGPAD